MPTYEYLCKQCGERFEKFQSFSARPLKTHDACGGEVQKVFHPSGVVFKGSGFYATDSRAAKRSTADVSASSSDSGAKSDSKADSGSKSDSKTDKKPDSPKSKERSAAAAAD
jgi:putative FmdB family regulatory protein